MTLSQQILCLRERQRTALAALLTQVNAPTPTQRQAHAQRRAMDERYRRLTLG